MATPSGPSSEYTPFAASELVARLPEMASASDDWRAGVLLVLERCFRISLYTDEGRALRFGVVISGGDAVLASEEFLHPAVEATVESLRRLCVAVDPRGSCLHVVVDGSSEGGARRVRIVGICARPELTDHPQGEQVVLVDVLDPACIALKGRQGEVRYERDGVRVPDGRDLLAHALPPECERAVERMMTPVGRGSSCLLPNGLALAEDAWQKSGERFSEQVRTSARPTLADGLVLLIGEIRRLAHGGTLVVTSEENRLIPRSSDAQRFERRRAWASEPWNRGMTDYVAWLACRNLALSGVAMVDGVKASGMELRNWAVDVAHAQCEQALVQWRADARRCAWLTQVDGAVVLDPLLEPRAFGLKITLDNYEGLPASWRAFLEGRGTRHRAAACIADSLESALALAVSQDGGVTLFVKSSAGALVQGLTV